MRFRVGLLLGVLWLTGCQAERPAALLDDYLARIARITESPAQRLPAPEGIPYPRHRERQLPMPELRARLLELPDFNRCNLTELVADRNSIMGRHWPASRQFDYELRFSHRLLRCQRWLQEQDDADETLRAWREQVDGWAGIKAEQRPLAWWAATYDGPEFERHFAQAVPWLRLDDRAPVAALERLVDLGQRLDDPPDGSDDWALETQLQTLREHRFGGQWLRSAQGLTQALDQAATQLDAVDTVRLCPQRRPTPQARIFETVFLQVYAGRVQPYLATVHQQGERWLTAQAALLATQPEPPPAFQRFAEQALGRGPESAWGRLAGARERHTRAWQRVLGDCGLTPGGARDA